MKETFEYYLEKYGLGKHETDTCLITVWSTYVDIYAHDYSDHRIDGPSEIHTDGYISFWFHGNLVAEFRKNQWQGPFYDWTIEQGIDIDNLTDEDKTLIKLVWG